ncbi:organic cation transporter protein [Lingula anatina]|uniref:Organic cation transporter protein n=1 Tax=Lingula anatina TaxID=7574 RepID=A0A1S3JQH5_LINAN|nr:organic cation transporter protein [Lingula anatina]|eukprot:XP_013412219.2 organic cation transporter protein [Lingula anatina]
MYATFNMLGSVFFTATPSYHCKVPQVYENVTLAPYNNLSSRLFPPNTSFPTDQDVNRVVPGKCSIVIRNVGNDTEDFISAWTGQSDGNRTELPCPEGRTYAKDIYTSTVVSEFDLACGSEWQVSTSKSVFFIGKLIGDIISGVISDRFGRRPSVLLALMVSVLLGIATALIPSMVVYVVSQGIQGVLNGFYFNVAYTIAVEFVGPSKRNSAAISMTYFFTLGYFVLVLFAYFIRDWRHLALALYAPCILFGFFWLTLPESFRWLLSRGRHSEAEELLRKVARWNKVDVKEGDIQGVLKTSRDAKALAETFTPLDLVKTRRRLAITASMCFIWMVNGMVYYGVSLGTEDLGGNLYVNFTLMGAIEIPAYAFAIYAVNKIGRRTTLIGTMLLGGIGCLVSGCLTSDVHWLIVTFAIIGKMGISASFVIIWLFTAECYPTVMRIIAIGMGSAFARFGSALGPQIMMLKDLVSYLPMVIFGLNAIAAGFLAMLLPETVNRKLPQNIREFDTLLNSAGLFGHCKAAATDSDNGSESFPTEDTPSDPDVDAKLMKNGTPAHSEDCTTSAPNNVLRRGSK